MFREAVNVNVDSGAESLARRAEFALGFNRFALVGVSIALVLMAAIWLLNSQFIQFLMFGLAMVPLLVCTLV